LEETEPRIEVQKKANGDFENPRGTINGKIILENWSLQGGTGANVQQLSKVNLKKRKRNPTGWAPMGGQKPTQNHGKVTRTARKWKIKKM